ncbi:hypothetical protein BK120_22480 [Paenibacillus sp. FSL A5-0031]|uniref:hypothetical protein n=1 Tax=Paenibacillus sp. FSL A5-0031 TaxID=1920420 RepID=UPI00096FD791|nr:hypothetical protein [Paenibacillus sp. FSL A5-0031]OME79070.1 hypothetical protein BK120_22480 [Paenibacillus sp. FSL A5-0031]
MSEIEKELPLVEVPTDLPLEEPEIPFEPDPVSVPEFPSNAVKSPSNKLLIFEDGTYEVGEWLHTESYPDSLMPYYIVDYGTKEGATLAAKILQLYPYFTLTVVDGVLRDVMKREKTQEEIDKENTPPPKTMEQLRIEQLENELALSKKSNLDTMDAVFDIYLMVLDLQAVGGEQT